ncbi:hypothetical protein AB669_05545 [Pedobacter sp. BMA]|nr:hypothetical protein AB669_05545 [Pedobacter sp. BMA]
MAVCIVHLHYFIGLNAYPVSKLLTYGQQGVAIFFVVSGFIIPYSLWNSNYTIRNFFRYLARRSLRIDPPVLAIIMITILITHEFNIVRILYNIFYLVPFSDSYKWYNGVFWTLGIEFQFYLIIGLTIGLIINKNIKVIVFFILLISMTGYFIQLKNNYGFILHSAHYFGFGILTLLIYKKRISILYGHILLFGLCFFLSCSISILTGCIGYFSALAILHLSFRNIITDYFGRISYSLYLTHPLAGFYLADYLKHFQLNIYLLILILVILCTLIANLFYAAIERPALKFSKRISIKNG